MPGSRGRFGLRNDGGHIKNGAVTGSISQTETLLRLSPAADSSQPTCKQISSNLQWYAQNKLHIIWIRVQNFTCKLRHCEFFQRAGSRSLIPVMVPIYLQIHKFGPFVLSFHYRVTDDFRNRFMFYTLQYIIIKTIWLHRTLHSAITF